ncbi:uncharacterized protein HGUI_01982 [Hanseniaspora guilliermondii]|uniref:Protein LOT5 n=1 Tax=Hanseniaspora guilliermondii TaxID=56406 RepID=A0A1L0FJK7_9ASCO|nr:uncharacterized protein HGUI_01982 [Hanseniaspora guilliermondii]
MNGSGKVFIKPNIDNVLPYQQYLKSVTSFPSHIQPLLFAGGRKLMMQVKDTGNITQDELYRCVSMDGIENLNENNYEIPHVNNTLIDCDVFILDIGIIIWFNEYGYGMKINSESIFYHGVTKMIIMGEERDAYQMCLELDKNDDYELMNILFGSCKMFGFKLDESNLINNKDLNRRLYLAFTFVPYYKEFDRHYNEIPENLFFYEWFGINRGDKLIENIFSAVDYCLEMKDSIQIDNDVIDLRQDSYNIEFDIHSQEIINNLHQGIADDL